VKKTVFALIQCRLYLYVCCIGRFSGVHKGTRPQTRLKMFLLLVNKEHQMLASKCTRMHQHEYIFSKTSPGNTPTPPTEEKGIDEAMRGEKWGYKCPSKLNSWIRPKYVASRVRTDGDDASRWVG